MKEAHAKEGNQKRGAEANPEPRLKACLRHTGIQDSSRYICCASVDVGVVLSRAHADAHRRAVQESGALGVGSGVETESKLEQETKPEHEAGIETEPKEASEGELELESEPVLVLGLGAESETEPAAER